MMLFKALSQVFLTLACTGSALIIPKDPNAFHADETSVTTSSGITIHTTASGFQYLTLPADYDAYDTSLDLNNLPSITGAAPALEASTEAPDQVSTRSEVPDGVLTCQTTASSPLVSDIQINWASLVKTIPSGWSCQSPRSKCKQLKRSGHAATGICRSGAVARCIPSWAVAKANLWVTLFCEKGGRAGGYMR